MHISILHKFSNLVLGSPSMSHLFANTFQDHINSVGTLKALEQELRHFGWGFVDDAVIALLPEHGIFFV